MARKEVRYFSAIAIAAIVMIAAFRLTANSEAKIGLIGFDGPRMMLLAKASEKTGIRVAGISPDRLLGEDLPSHDLIYLNVHGLNINEAVTKALDQMKAKGTKVVALGGNRDLVQQVSNVDLKAEHPELMDYWRYGGLENYKRLLSYSDIQFSNASGQVEAPIPTPSDGIYHPDSEDIFTSYSDYDKWYKAQEGYKAESPMVVMTGSVGWQTGDTATTDAVIRRFEKEGVRVAAIFGREKRLEMIKEAKTDAIVTRAHGRWQGNQGPAFLEENDIPLIHSTWLSETVEDWMTGGKKPNGRGMAMNVSVPELDGAVEPMAIAGRGVNDEGYAIRVPIPERIERVVERTLGWIRLQRTSNPNKRVAIVYYAGPGKGDIGGGGLDVYPSLVTFLERMKKAGYQVNDIPDKDALRAMVDSFGRNVGSWAPGELERLVKNEQVVMLPLETYKAWFKEILSPKNQERVIKAHGEAPGNGMVYIKEGKEYLVIPQVPMGNVVLLPQPGKGGDEDDETIYGADATPPPHQYLAVYFWLEKGFKAEGLVHYGTHGNLEFLPGKPAIMTGDDWGDLLVGTMPNIYVYIMDDVGEALTAKHRSYAAIVSYLTPPLVEADIYGDLKVLQNLIHHYKNADDGMLKVEYSRDVTNKFTELKLDLDLGITIKEGLMTEDQIKEVDAYLHRLAAEKMPDGLHVHGKVPETDALVPIVRSMIGDNYLETLAEILPFEETVDEETKHEIAKEKGEALLRYVLVDGLTQEAALKKVMAARE